MAPRPADRTPDTYPVSLQANWECSKAPRNLGKKTQSWPVFPLAEHGEYDRLLGSRHRAAIGLSKETDAVVVVVSEETGHIGLASDGKLARMLTLEQLRLQLLDTMVPNAKRQPAAPAPSALTKISPKIDKKALENLQETEDNDKE